MTLGIPFQRVHDLKALGVHQLLGLGALFGIEAGNRRLIVDHLTRQHPVFKVQLTGEQGAGKAGHSVTLGKASNGPLSHSHHGGYNSTNSSRSTWT